MKKDIKENLFLLKMEKKNKMTEYKRADGRKLNELREIQAKVGIIPNADGSAMFSFGKGDHKTMAIAAVYGPKKMHPQHSQDPSKCTLRCDYSMVSFSTNERMRTGPNRRSTEISKITEWALEPLLLVDEFKNMVIDVHIFILQADASTRCAGINAAALALAHAGIPMKDLASSVSTGKIDKDLVLDLNSYEDCVFHEGEGSTDIPFTFTGKGEITHIQLDGKIETEQLKEVVKMAREACKKIHEIQKQALKDSLGDLK